MEVEEDNNEDNNEDNAIMKEMQVPPPKLTKKKSADLIPSAELGGLNKLARLDTCVTVIDASSLFSNFQLCLLPPNCYDAVETRWFIQRLNFLLATSIS